MLSLFRKKSRSITLDNTQQTLIAEPGETILQAALREGIRFPHSCRVGGCAACKCQLRKGQVKELTESAYVLNTEDLDNGYILACQSVPKSDVSISIPDWDERSPDHAVQKVSGMITGQRFLTHDITAITIELDQPLMFTAGQYAQLSLAGDQAPARAYSFAETCGEQGAKIIEFFIRSVEGGALSPRFRDPAIRGARVNIEGPYGDFWLRPDDTPIFAIAGGSGLAPLLSILRQGVAEQSTRPVTLLFGARTQADLYALDEISQLEALWAGPFEFIPVLSSEPEDSDWQGLRGWVTQAIEGRISGTSQVYLCGPAGMIDAAIEECQKFSVRPTQIFFDKFLDSRDLAVKEQLASA
ncbi:2Fe-2S iron-sulfur cluster-binding protein [Thalassolituus marinus]|uniref:2Fe-2S iron-sulfur cluster binding domain-containing protein n=1 Tax=Thalassolituus marinus TaxID=671053 RepID=A0ABS7ZT05_9GAMM|nr:2Fe-2S iron-sulfur cluster binding domain-containing protein [Thalassolituus marinus]MCA6064814.1 2Fe-2S iron-sulfur cluster binding domain-containing protein [Thalassolituus marinus]